MHAVHALCLSTIPGHSPLIALLRLGRVLAADGAAHGRITPTATAAARTARSTATAATSARAGHAALALTAAAAAAAGGVTRQEAALLVSARRGGGGEVAWMRCALTWRSTPTTLGTLVVRDARSRDGGDRLAMWGGVHTAEGLAPRCTHRSSSLATRLPASLRPSGMVGVR